MKEFTIFQHPSGEIQALKQGFCWPAFFFLAFGAMIAKMWLLGIVFVSIGLIIAFISLVTTLRLLFPGFGAETEALIKITSLIISILFGIKGNAWRESNLLSRGFEKKTKFWL